MGDMISTIKDATYYGPTDTILCTLANVTLVALYLSPIPTIWRICKRDSTEEFHPYPYLFTLTNCWLWMIYSAFVGQPPVSPFYGACLSLSNSIGFLFSVAYVGSFQACTTERYKKIMACFSVGLFVLLISCFCTYCYCCKTNDEVQAFTMIHHFFGSLCVVSGILMYASPLFNIRDIYITKSVEYLPLWYSLACFVNGVVWIVYICASPISDPYIAITNGVGTLLGLFQLLVYYKFHAHPQGYSRVHPVDIIF